MAIDLEITIKEEITVDAIEPGVLYIIRPKHGSDRIVLRPTSDYDDAIVIMCGDTPDIYLAPIKDLIVNPLAPFRGKVTLTLKGG